MYGRENRLNETPLSWRRHSLARHCIGDLVVKVFATLFMHVYRSTFQHLICFCTRWIDIKFRIQRSKCVWICRFFSDIHLELFWWIYPCNWGLKKPDQNDVIVLVAVDQTGMVPFSPPAAGAYLHRIRGGFNGNSSSAQAIFTLGNITKDDERLFGYKIIASDFSTLFDSVQLSFIEVLLPVNQLVVLFS